ncbi:hypothetical protein IOCL2690_000137000 [Leishmania lindenbergi]|uniref:Homoserine dehydrogenase n=1 Tax=Leishmania lindenbergi TaxID=651832 RepID=A0AAW3ASE4_9TRYP
MTVVRAALLGVGPVGQGVYGIAQQRHDELKQKFGDTRLVTVKKFPRTRPSQSRVRPEGWADDAEPLTDDIEDIFRADAHVIFEAMVGEEPAFTYTSSVPLCSVGAR